MSGVSSCVSVPPVPPPRLYWGFSLQFSQDRLPYQRGYRDRTDSELHKFEEQSPSFVEDYYSTRRSRHHRRSRERHRTRKHQHRCRKRRTRSCSSTSSVSSIQNEFRKCSRAQWPSSSFSALINIGWVLLIAIFFFFFPSPLGTVS